MIEMPNSQMIANNHESSSMDTDALTATTTDMAMAMSVNASMPEDMIFNAGHQLSIIVYRFVKHEPPHAVI